MPNYIHMHVYVMTCMCFILNFSQFQNPEGEYLSSRVKGVLIGTDSDFFLGSGSNLITNKVMNIPKTFIFELLK